ncbi:MAG: 1-acyl-sn-glycerol-3-phosphate acyltransferase [Alphaproteobacteria bacterium]|nr:1-acyl-sn-glycerol-3-phosphate acyltransferase [Alphaproteobacteria bacterium]
MFRVILPSFLFYVQAAAHIGSAAIQARRGRLSNERLVEGSHALRRSLESVGVRFEVSGVEGVDWGGGPYVFAANHMSALETQILPSVLSPAGPCTFVVKASLMRYPVFGPVLKAFDPIVVERVDAKADLRQVLLEGGRRLADGKSVIVFPQAHRTEAFDRKGFNSIGVRLARSAGVPVVPIALHTTAWSQGRWVSDIGWIRPIRPARFAIGTPVPVGTDSREAQEQVLTFIESRLADWSPTVSPTG